MNFDKMNFNTNGHKVVKETIIKELNRFFNMDVKTNKFEFALQHVRTKCSKCKQTLNLELINNSIVLQPSLFVNECGQMISPNEKCGSGNDLEEAIP